MTSTAQVVLTCLTADGAGLLVIPHEWVASELQTYGVLQHAATFGEVRRHPPAAETLEDALDAYLQAEEQRGVEEPRRPSDDDPWNPEEYFAPDGWRTWRPDPRESTVAFVEQVNDVVGLLRPDQAWGHDYEPQAFVHPDDRDDVESTLRGLGYEVRQWQAMADAYLDAPRDVLEAMRTVGSPTEQGA